MLPLEDAPLSLLEDELEDCSELDELSSAELLFDETSKELLLEEDSDEELAVSGVDEEEFSKDDGELASLDDDISNDGPLEENSAEDEIDWEFADDSDEEPASPAGKLLCANEEELAIFELDDDAGCDCPKTDLNCSSVTQVSPTQIFFALIVSFSKVIPNNVLNLSVIQAKRPNDGSFETFELLATLASKPFTFKFNSWMALARSAVNFG